MDASILALADPFGFLTGTLDAFETHLRALHQAMQTGAPPPPPPANNRAIVVNLVIIGVVNSAISIYYYLRIVTAMYFRDARDPMTPSRSPSLALVMALCPLVILEMGVLPGFWLKLGL